MVTFVINRKTGEEKIVDVYHDPRDNPLEATGALFAEMIIKQGLLEKLKSQSA
ncbi:hypothetical protein [Pelosinus sp. IPA-1]|uniref:hypothetical protein n=1 Tax=Pelosinus sp. IPA-1 TaxID=3029569 RepID=UPI002436227B|nr:hypothetical protein [Pelosinus sp. IPA-1]GMB01048.1 hypothetical protein PIPA1_38470 [Pelosinus sp. IPA-1]